MESYNYRTAANKKNLLYSTQTFKQQHSTQSTLKKSSSSLFFMMSLSDTARLLADSLRLLEVLEEARLDLRLEEARDGLLEEPGGGKYVSGYTSTSSGNCCIEIR